MDVKPQDFVETDDTKEFNGIFQDGVLEFLGPDGPPVSSRYIGSRLTRCLNGDG